MKLNNPIFFTLTVCLLQFTLYSQEDAAAASSTGSVAAPSKGAPKAAQANHKLRTLHIAIHKLGLSHSDIKSLSHNSGSGLDGFHELYKKTLKEGGTIKEFQEHHDLLVKDHTLEDAVIYGEFLRDPQHEGKSTAEALEAAKEQHADTYAQPNLLISDALSTTLGIYGTDYQRTEQFESALTLATTLLTDKSLTTSLPTPITLNTLSSGHNLAFIRLLSAYGALGSNGENLATEVLGSAYSGYSDESELSGSLGSSTDYLSFLSTLTGGRTFSEEDASLKSLDVQLNQVQLVGASTFTLGAANTDESEVDVYSRLKEAETKSDRKVLIIGAAKDIKSAGDITFTNQNNAEDHALVLGAADDIMIDGSNIEYTGSNLAIGSGDTGEDSMHLVNTEIKTGGNLALGSLGTINISTAKFSVGTANSLTSDPDNVYIYANDLIDANNLAFAGRVDDIYMESRTIHLKNTVFPSTADVMLRSQLGSLHISESATDIVSGGVNFHKVKHLGIGSNDLIRSDFSGVDGHINSNAALPNGTPFIKVRKQ